MTTVEQQIRAIQTQGVFPIGKYFGQSITDIMVSDPGYCDWVRKRAAEGMTIPMVLVDEFNTRPLRELQAYKDALRLVDKRHRGDIFEVKLMLDAINDYVKEEMDK